MNEDNPVDKESINIEEVSSYQSMNLKYIPFLWRLLFVWIFGVQLALTVILGYYSYYYKSQVMLFSFIFFYLKYIWDIQKMHFHV